MEKLFERLLKLVNKLENGSQSQFAKKIGCPQTTFNGYLNEKGQDKIRFSLLEKVLNIYPNISREWLFFGEEPMLKSSEPQKNEVLEARVEALENEVQRLRTQIFVEGASDQDGLTDTGKAAGQE